MHHDRAEHVHVCFTGRWSEGVEPGLLLSCRPPHEGRGWEGWVIAAEPAPSGAAEGVVRQSWVPASAIRPVSG